MPWLNLAPAMVRVSTEAMTVYLGGLCLVGIWAGLSRRHWFLRSLVLVAAIATLAPIRAYEPLLLCLVSVPAIAVIMAGLRWRFSWAISNRSGMECASDSDIWLGLLVYGFLAFLVFAAIVLSWAGFVPPSPVPDALCWYEWAVLAAFILGLTVVVVRQRRSTGTERQEQQTAETRSETRWGFRFAMQDLLLMVVIAAMVCSLLTASLAKPLIIKWSGLLGTAACLVAVTTAAASVVLFRRWFILLPVTVGVAVAVHTWLLDDWTQAKVIAWTDDWQAILICWTVVFSVHAAFVVGNTYLLSAAGAISQFRRGVAQPRSNCRVEWIVVVCVGLVVYAPLGAVYWQMLGDVSMPDTQMPKENAYPEIMATVHELVRLNPTEATVDDIRKLAGDDQRSRKVEEALLGLRALLERPAYVPLDWQRDTTEAYWSQELTRCQEVRSVARTLDTMADAEKMSGRFDEASVFGLMSIRLGNAQQAGGLLGSVLGGINFELQGTEQIVRVRDDVSPDALRRLLDALLAVDRKREPRETMFQRDVAWGDWVYTWRQRVVREPPIVLAWMEPQEYGATWNTLSTLQACGTAMDSRDAMLRLLITDLAIRLFRHEKGSLPETLAELTPLYLAELPIDPYSKEPFVYHCDGASFVLYSVWKDGVDNDGAFGTYNEIFGSQTHDLDLDVHTRPAAATPSSAAGTKW